MKFPSFTHWRRLALVKLALMAMVACVSHGWVPACAADAPAAGGQPAQVMERLAEAEARLGLSAEQKEAVTPILKASWQSRKAILEKYGFGPGTQPRLSLGDKVKLGRELRAVRDDTETALAQHLSASQMDEYRKMQDEARDRAWRRTTSH